MVSAGRILRSLTYPNHVSIIIFYIFYPNAPYKVLTNATIMIVSNISA
jgi:uncharacterized membrane protein